MDFAKVKFTEALYLSLIKLFSSSIVLNKTLSFSNFLSFYIQLLIIVRYILNTRPKLLSIQILRASLIVIFCFNTSPKSVVFWTIFCHIFKIDIDEPINRSDRCSFIYYSVLKNKPLFQILLVFISWAVYFYNQEFLFNMTRTYATNVIFIYNAILNLNNNLVCIFFLIFKFGIIIESLIFNNYSYRLRIFLTWKNLYNLKVL